jgi:hypothetical protein
MPKVSGAGPAVTVTPTNPLSGQLVTVMGTGFPVSSGGTVWIDINGDLIFDRAFESAYSSRLQTSSTGTFVVSLTTIDLAMGTYSVVAQVPDGSPVVGSTQINVQDPAVNAIQSAQSALSNQINGAQSALAGQISAVQSDLDNKIGSPKQGTSDTLFSLLYGIQNSISNAVSTIQTSISSALSQLSSQISSVQTDLDTRIGAPHPGTTDTLFSLAYTLQSSVSNGFANLSTSVSSLSTQLAGVQSDIDGRLGVPSTTQDCAAPCPPDTVFSLLYGLQGSIGTSATNITNAVNSDFSALTSQINNVQSDVDSRIGSPGSPTPGPKPPCAVPCPPDTVFSLLYGIQGSVDNSLTSVTKTVNDDFLSLSVQLASVQSDIDTRIGTPNVATDTVFKLLYNIQNTQNTISTNVSAISTQLTGVQSDLDNKLGAPAPGETVFGDLQNIQTSLNSLTGLQTSINTLQASLSKLSGTATVVSGTGKLALTGPGIGQENGYQIFVNPNGKVCTVTVTLLPIGLQTGEVVEVGYVDFAPGYFVGFDTHGTSYTITAASSSASVAVLWPDGATNHIEIDYAYSATCPAA